MHNKYISVEKVHSTNKCACMHACMHVCMYGCNVSKNHK